MSENLQESEAQDFPGPIFLPLSSKSARPGIGLLWYKYYLSREARFQDVRFGLELPRILVLGTSWAAPFVWRNDNFPTQWPVWCKRNKQFHGRTGQSPQITRKCVELRFALAFSLCLLVFRQHLHGAVHNMTMGDQHHWEPGVRKAPPARDSLDLSTTVLAANRHAMHVFAAAAAHDLRVMPLALCWGRTALLSLMSTNRHHVACGMQC